MRALLLLLVLAPAALRAQEYQLRFLTHGQLVPRAAPLGLAGWAILPNVMNENDPWRTKLLGGVVLRNERRWVEVLVGAMLSELARPAPEINVRYQERGRRLSFSMDAEYTVPSSRLSLIGNSTVRLQLAGLRVGLGVEGEWTRVPGPDVLITGPRVAVTVPLCSALCRSAAVITAYRMHRDGQRTVRQYVAVNF